MGGVTTNSQVVTTSLAAISGNEHVRLLGRATAVAPADSDEIAAILRFAMENHFAVVPWGGGTKQGWGYAVEPMVVLEMHRLNVLREHTWQDMTCTVEAGSTWGAMQSALGQHGQCVALDPLWPETATVGGVIATNDSGALRLRYGGLRDLVIGMTIVLADGTIARTGGKVVKNVAGYDLHKLMIGAFGTLGVITSVNFRLHSIPKCTRSFTAFAPTAAPLGEFLLTLLHEQLSTVSIQLRGVAEGFYLDIQLASLPEVLHTQADLLESLARVAGLSLATVTAAVWDTRQAMMSHDLACKATMLPTEIAAFAERVCGMGGVSVTQATGIMMAGLPAGAGESVTQLRGEIEAASGSLMVLKQAAGTKLECWGTPPDSLPLMREIKRRFDATGVLNPGRFLGGI